MGSISRRPPAAVRPVWLVTDQAPPLLNDEVAFYTFAREERQLMAVLAHLLMTEGENLRRFIALVGQGVAVPLGVPSSDGFELAQVYVEFAFLRDWWNRLGKDPNQDKRARLWSWFDGCHTARTFRRQYFPRTPRR